VKNIIKGGRGEKVRRERGRVARSRGNILKGNSVAAKELQGLILFGILGS